MATNTKTRATRLIPTASLIFAAVATTCGTPCYAAQPVQTKSDAYDISFDGFCDGMNLTISGPKGDDVNVVGQSSGCEAGKLDVGFTAKRGKYNFLDVATNDDGVQPLIFVLDDPRRNQGNGWCAYNTTDGVTINIINCGTYTIGTPKSPGPSPAGVATDAR